MKPATFLIRLIRLCFFPFLLNTSFAIVTYLVTPLLLGVATQAFFDAVTRSHEVDGWVAVGVVTAVLVGQAAAGPVFRAPWSPLQQKAMALMRANLFTAILRNYGRTGLPISASESVSRFRDDPMLIADALDAVSDLIGRSLFAIGAAVLMWRVSPLITISLFLPLLLSSVVVEALESRIVSYRNAARAMSGNVTSFLGDLLTGQLALKVAHAAPFAVARLEQMGDARREAEVRDAVFGSMLDAFNNNLGSVGIGVVLLLGASSIHSGAFTVGDLALFAVFLDALGWYPAEVGRLLGDLKRIDVSSRRMIAMAPHETRDVLVADTPLNLSVAAASPANTAAPAPMPRSDVLRRLEVIGLTYDHARSSGGIADVSFTLEQSSFTVITGRIGSGKSTLLHVLLGLLPRDSGRIYWNGAAVDDPATVLVPPKCAFTPQVPRLFSETIRENVLMGVPADGPRLAGAVRAAVLESDLAAMTHGLDELVGPRGVKLSGGQMQRVAAARMFVRDADLFIFDDLSSALDVETENELWARMADLRGHKTCLVVSNRPAALRLADQILFMEDGRLKVQSAI